MSSENDATIDEILADTEGYMDRARARARPDAEVARCIAERTEQRRQQRSIEIAAMPWWYRWAVRWWEAPRWDIP
jgi:hypothetical protein